MHNIWNPLAIADQRKSHYLKMYHCDYMPEYPQVCVYRTDTSGTVGYLAKDDAMDGFPMHLSRITFTELT